MRIFKNKAFTKWAQKEGLNDATLTQAIKEIEQGLIDANLGGHVYKKRVAIDGRGKSASARTVVAFRVQTKAFFIYGFAKNKQANIKADELKALKLLAALYFSYSDKELTHAIECGLLNEIKPNE